MVVCFHLKCVHTQLDIYCNPTRTNTSIPMSRVLCVQHPRVSFWEHAGPRDGALFHCVKQRLQQLIPRPPTPRSHSATIVRIFYYSHLQADGPFSGNGDAGLVVGVSDKVGLSDVSFWVWPHAVSCSSRQRWCVLTKKSHLSDISPTCSANLTVSITCQ